MQKLRSDSGAVAVEFALVMVPLLLILLGIIDFGRAYGSQLSVSAAAREGVRSMAVQGVESTAKNVAISAAGELSPALTTSQIAITYTKDGGSVAACSSGASVTMTVTYPLTSLTGMFASTFAGKNIREVGVMRCNG